MRNCKCELEECLFCPHEALNKRLCSKCNTDYYPKENDQLNTGKYIKCYKDPEGFYLDNYLYKKCYYTCKKCNISGNSITHGCLECDDNYPIEIIHTNYKNCHEKCNFFHFFDNDNNYHCTTNFSCPDEYPKLLENQKECTKNENKINDLIIKDEKENITIVTEIEYSKYLKEYIEKKLTKNYDTTNIDNGQDEFIKMGKMALAISSLKNQKNNKNNNMTSIDLGDCEDLLRDDYNISINNTIYIAIIDIEQEGIQIPKVEYFIYSKLFGKNLIQLNLTVCINNNIRIYIPIYTFFNKWK